MIYFSISHHIIQLIQRASFEGENITALHNNKHVSVRKQVCDKIKPFLTLSFSGHVTTVADGSLL